MKIKKVLFVFLFLIMGTGCSGITGKSLKKSSLSFNYALQHAIGEQMLLNLVRLRYGENPVFLEVSSISSQYSFSGDLSASAQFKRSSESYGIGLGFSYAERPTFTFTPLQGEKFARRLLSPIPINHLILLLNSGWRVDRVLRLCVQNINGIPNAPTASGPTPSEPPKYKKFLELTKKLELLRKRGKIKFTYIVNNNQTIPVFIFYGNSALVKEVKEILGLKEAPYYPVVGMEVKRSPSVIQVETRSLIGVLFYLSQGVEVPKEDIKAGRVAITEYKNGKVFSWKTVIGDIFSIHESKKLPEDAAIAIKFRNHWFYIKDTDISTKSTFILLQQLFALEASKGKGTSPILTLPIGD
jgi:hypothetical protein